VPTRDADQVAVQRMYELMFDNDLDGQFQVIVSDHTDLPLDLFQ
jgi:hypothetical protein